MASKKTKAQLEAEVELLKYKLWTLRKANLSEGAVQVVNNGIRWGSICFISYNAYLSIEVLAGKNTLADIGIGFLTDINVSVAISWALAAGGVLYGYGQRRLRKNGVEHLAKRNQRLELIIDPERTSSNLTERGDTRPEDKI